MPTPEKHAFLSASSAHRWLACTASPHFEAKLPDGDAGEYAREGTLAHAICELYARKKFNLTTTRRFNSDLKKLQAQPLYSDEMLRTAETYVEYLEQKAMSYTEKPYVTVEVRVDFGEYVPNGFGTCDCCMIGGDLLHITDYKHGKGVPVSAEGNPQMRLYALGALRRYNTIYGDRIKRVSMGIVQPRLSEECSEELLTVEELEAWGESIKPKAKEAYDGPGTFCPGDHCRFCKGKAVCSARAGRFMGFTEFEDSVIKGRQVDLEAALAAARDCYGDMPPVLSDEDVGELLIAAAGLVDWYKDLQDYAMSALQDGKEIPGWKLVEGRSVRAFDDADLALKILSDAGYEEAVLYDRKPKTLAQLEKLLGKREFAETLGAHVIRPRGKPTLAPANDKRPAYNIGAAEFEGAADG